MCCGLSDNDDLDGKSQSGVVFFHQSAWQQEMLLKYGSDVCILDSTYNTSVYDLPLFALSVKTNAGYFYVATFLLLSETMDSFQEALTRLRDVNAQWRPKCFVTDFSEAQINALQSTFPGKLILYLQLIESSCKDTVIQLIICNG